MLTATIPEEVYLVIKVIQLLPATKWNILVVAIALSAAACHTEVASTLPKLPVLATDGLLSNVEILPFLIAHKLADSNQSGHPPADTVIAGRYFKTNSNNYVVLLRTEGKEDEPNQLIFATADSIGQLIKHTTIDAWDSWCAESAIESFCHHGPYFFVKGCGHGSGYYNESVRVFTENSGLVADNEIFLSNYAYSPITHPSVAQTVNSKISVAGDSIMVIYQIKEGNKDADDIKWEEVEKVVVTYTTRKRLWVANDSTLLSGLDMGL